MGTQSPEICKLWTLTRAIILKAKQGLAWFLLSGRPPGNTKYCKTLSVKNEKGIWYLLPLIQHSRGRGRWIYICMSEDNFEESILFPPCRFQGLNSSYQDEQQAPLPADPSPWPKIKNKLRCGGKCSNTRLHPQSLDRKKLKPFMIA